jgi:hypothetical protein
MNAVLQLQPKTARMFSYHNKSVVRKIVEEGFSQAEAEQLFSDMLQFLYVAYISKKPCAPTKKIDTAWHQFILHTKDYAAFCNEFFGVFLHHTPGGKNEKGGKYAKNKAKAVFGVLSSNWDTSSEDCADCCQSPISCSTCAGRP